MTESGIQGKNVETKARCRDLDRLARTLSRSGAWFEGRLDQVDTYFDTRGTRLKLREYTHRLPDGRSISAAELIRYERPDRAGARDSDYVRTPLEDPAARREELAGRHGIRGVVTKRRALWILGSTRVHLDHVEHLGEFVELETVIGDRPEAARAEHEALLELLAVDPGSTIAVSYIDLHPGGSPTTRSAVPAAPGWSTSESVAAPESGCEPG